MEAYLDNSATTMVSENVAKLMYEIMTKDYGNPSSMHQKGVDAEKYIKKARETFAGILKVAEKEIFFTSGGTESDNLAIIGTAMANKRRGKHIITTVFEHPAILETYKFLEEQGFELTFLPVDSNGHVETDTLRNALREDTILVSVMYINNEIGAVEPIADLGKIVKDYNPAIVFHVDAVQAFGKFRIYPYKDNVDLMLSLIHISEPTRPY